MNSTDLLQMILFLALVLLPAAFLGKWMVAALTGGRTFLTPVLGPVERLIYALGGVKPDAPMNWKQYAGALLAFNALGMLVVLTLQLTQKWLPLNPAELPNVPFPLAFNTAVSFMTNTNWQAYSGESSLSYLTQMVGLGVQNFVSAGTGIAVMLGLARGIASRSGNSLGNFWADLTRATLYVLLPLSAVLALVLVSQGVVQSFSPYAQARTLEGAEQVLPLGPAASQIAIKQLGTNGGGFFGVNSAHPYENPTPLSNLLQMVSILLIPAALPITFGYMLGKPRHGWCIFAAMAVLFLASLGVSLWAEYQPNTFNSLTQNLEGKETRLGLVNSVLWGSATTVASNGSVNSMHDSWMPLSGGLALFNIMLGEVIFGGVGAGLYGMLMFVLLTVFMAGLMVGRTPEYLGKKIESREIILAVAAVIIPCAVILLGSAIALSGPWGTATRNNPGAHGLTEVLYAWSSAAGNNGSAFAGLGANTDFYNYGLGLAMLLGRFGVILPALAIAGSLAGKKVAPPSLGTFPTDGGTFVLLLVCVVLIVGGLTFLPVLSLGPIVEHLMLSAGL